MEAARVLSLRGHSVTLYDKNKQLGGLLNIASIPPYRQGIKSFVNYLENQLKNLKVDIKLNYECEANTKGMSNFDIIIFANGSKPISKIEGIDTCNVMTADECLLSKKIKGQHYIIVGGGAVGLQCADFLTKKKKDIEVIVIEKENSIGRDMGNIEKKMILNRVLNRGVRILINSQILKIESNQIVIDVNGQKKNFLFDSLITAVGRSPDNKLFYLIKDKQKKKYMIGDCVQPRKIVDAVHEAYELALKI